MSRNQRGLDNLEAKFTKHYGDKAAKIGGLRKKKIFVPSGSLALDYELGTGGWPLGKLVGVFGPRDIGKSSMVGMHGIANAQRMGVTCGWIAYEPFDEEWAEKNGVNVEELFMVYPETAEEAWAMFHDMIRSQEMRFIVFDSVGALRGESEMGEDGKPRVGGVALINTWGVSVAAVLAEKYGVGAILLNQVRTVIGQTHGVVYQQPGGNALEHMEQIIVQLKRGKEKYTIVQNGSETVVGQRIKAVITRNKCSEGTGRVATFDYFYSTANGNELGVDRASDIVNTAKRTGVIVQRGSMFDLPDGSSHKGMPAVASYIELNPPVLEQIREGVLAAMSKREEIERSKQEPEPEEGETDGVS